MSATTGHAEAGELGHVDRGGEALDPEVARVHLEHAAGVRADRVGVVAQVRAVGGADLAQPRAGGGDQVGQPEAVADLDHLAAADDDLAAGGQRGRGEHEGGGAVVDDEDLLGVGHGGAQRGEGAAAAAGPAAGRQVELHVDVPGGRDAAPRRPRPTAAARPRLVCSTTPVALSTGRRLLRAAGSAASAASATSAGDSSPARARSWAAATARLTTATPEPFQPRLAQARVGQHGVGARHAPPRVDVSGHRLTLCGRVPGPSTEPALSLCRRGSGRPAASVEIARRRAEEERDEALFPRRATTTAADQSAMREQPNEGPAEADGNRTRQAEMLGFTGFEDREGHQAPIRLR